MIESIRHKGLKRFFHEDDRNKLQADMVERIRDLLTALDAATTVEDLDLPTFRLHALKGDLRGHWAITVRANWRMVFRFENGKVLDVDLVDYH
ncbi:MAG: type II toxin-antitoxin system RelE/ParE family toxin [Rhizobiaceae bacterium]